MQAATLKIFLNQAVSESANVRFRMPPSKSDGVMTVQEEMMLKAP